MGLFSGSTVINVASSVYNMAGDELDRPIFLKNLVIRNILSGTKRGMGETIVSGHLNGPAIKFKTFHRWAVRNYDLIGMPTGNMFSGDTINTNTVAAYIPHTSEEKVWVQTAKLSDSEYGMWADQWMIENEPGLYDTNWEADFDDATQEITITFEDTTTVSFIANDFVMGDKYIYAYYTISTESEEEPVEEGTPVPLAPGDPFPDVTGYTLTSTSDTDRAETLETMVTVVDTFSDGRPNEGSTSTTSTTEIVTRTVDIYEKETDDGNDGEDDGKLILREILRLVTDEKVLSNVTTTTVDTEIEPGVTRSRTTITTEDYLKENNSYRNDTQKVFSVKWEPLAMWIYRIGSGTAALDAMVQQVANYGLFFPSIPIRLDNKFLHEIDEADVPNIDEIITLVKRTYRRGTDGGKYSSILKELEDNEDIDDMDYIYVIYGVSLNVIDRSARRYIYEFFQRLRLDQANGPDAGQQFFDDMEDYTAAYAIWEAWRDARVTFPPTPEPSLPPKPSMPENEIKIQNLGEEGSLNINFDIRLKWNYITETLAEGLGKPTARVNDVWLEDLGEIEIEDPTYTGEDYRDDILNGLLSNNTQTYHITRIWWQYEPDKHRYMDVVGLEHQNFVYSGKSVKITAKEALMDGEESGFVIPLHYATYHNMRLIDATQMGTACVFLMFNVYEKKKKKWWQSGIFAVIFVIIIAIVSVVFTGGAGIGLLGPHMQVGALLGLAGGTLTAAIVGSVANALAALVLSTLITKLTAKLGEFGAILGAILQIAITGAMINFHAGAGFTFDFSQLMKVENIMKLTNAAGNGYAAYIQSSIIDMQNELIEFQEEANRELRRIRENYIEQFGYGGGQIDPTMFIGDNSPVIAESRDTFLTRTLMCGSDVAQMSHDLLNDYVELNMTLTNAFN